MILQLGQTDFARKLKLLDSAVKLAGLDQLYILNETEIGKFKLVVVLQNTPDEFCADDIQRLLSAFPLSRLLVIYGPWCEGDGRNRQLWPNSLRCPWYLAEVTMQQMLLCESYYLPLTASREECFRYLYAGTNNAFVVKPIGQDSADNNASVVASDHASRPTDHLAIVSCDWEYANSLFDYFQLYFPQVEVIPSGKIALLSVQTKNIIYDLDDAPLARERALVTLDKIQHKKILLLTGFPHQWGNLPFPVLAKATPLTVMLRYFQDHGNRS